MEGRQLPKQQAGTGYTLDDQGRRTRSSSRTSRSARCGSAPASRTWSGRSNAGETPDKVQEAAKNPNLRLFTVRSGTAPHPIDRPGRTSKHFTKWMRVRAGRRCGSSRRSRTTSAELQKELGVPVGLIHTSWGGTPAQAWTSLEALDAVPELKHYADDARTAVKNYEEYDQKKALEAYEKALAK